jgi:hypothetical protein
MFKIKVLHLATGVPPSILWAVMGMFNQRKCLACINQIAKGTKTSKKRKSDGKENNDPSTGKVQKGGWYCSTHKSQIGGETTHLGAYGLYLQQMGYQVDL